jgi:hypothetical protein
MSKAIVVETQRQFVRIKVIQSLNVVITTIEVETIVVPNMNVGKRGVIIGFVINLGHGSNRFLVGRNLNRNSRLIVANTKVIATP